MAYPGIFELVHSIGYVIGVLPSTLKSKALCVYFQMYSRVDHQVLPKRLLKPRVELVTMAGAQRRSGHARAARNQRLKRFDHRVRASHARQHQVLVERGLHGARIGQPQHRVGGLEIVSCTQTRLAFRGGGQAVIFIETQAQIEGPVFDADRVLEVERELLNIRVAVEIVGAAIAVRAAVRRGQRSRPRQVIAARIGMNAGADP